MLISEQIHKILLLTCFSPVDTYQTRNNRCFDSLYLWPKIFKNICTLKNMVANIVFTIQILNCVECQFEKCILTHTLRKLGPHSPNTRNGSVSNHCKCFCAVELYWLSMMIGRGRPHRIAIVDFRHSATRTVLLCENSQTHVHLWNTM